MKQAFLMALFMLLISCEVAFADLEEDAIRINMNELNKRHGNINKDAVADVVDNKKIVATISSMVFSKCVDDAGVVAHNKPVVQSDLTITHLRSGVYVDIWHSMSLTQGGISNNYGNEIDYSIGWSGDFAGIGIDAGVTYIDVIDLFTMPVGDVIQPYVELSRKFEVNDRNMITPFIKTEYGTPAKGNARELKGLHIHSGLKHNWNVKKRLTVTQQFVLTFDDGAFGANRAWIGAYDLSPSYRFLEKKLYNLSLDLSARVIGPIADSKNDTRKLQLIGGVGLSVNF